VRGVGREGGGDDLEEAGTKKLSRGAFSRGFLHADVSDRERCREEDLEGLKREDVSGAVGKALLPMRKAVTPKT